jgi:hypothetical protein
VLDLGVTSENHPTANFLEKIYPYPEKLTCAGIQGAGHIEDTYPGVRFFRIEPSKRLPFKDQEFDVVYSNAVVEHTGSRRDQAAFIAEALRVSQGYFITTPNRWFPIEHHTSIPLIHFLPQELYRSILRAKGEVFYSEERNLNLLTRQKLQDIFPAGISIEISFIRTLGFASNIVAYGSHQQLKQGRR